MKHIWWNYAHPAEDDISPEIDKHGVPWCNERCRAHDGKRCDLTGFKPRGVCEPEVAEMAALISRLRAGGCT